MTAADILARIRAGEYVTTMAACAALGADITPERLRDWKRRGLIDVVRDPNGVAVRVAGRRGRENVWRWRDLVAVEAEVAASGRGRPRKTTLAGV